ncbi:MAG: zinc ribbon domain-containing protein [Anaerolineae bacterium]|jgi:putative FmdB family regulatory protein|nr:zinc ribbon domain-containing protein [Anaerolineae bacterium]MDH7475489.1 zinc ribbon domain-containing protein [Anaerolineae bacterium]
MPVYVYQCNTCGMTFERRQSITEEPLRDCPECEGQVHRVIQPVGVIFKGSGFYVTDNRAHSPIATPGGNGKSAKSGTTEKAESDAGEESIKPKKPVPEITPE